MRLYLSSLAKKLVSLMNLTPNQQIFSLSIIRLVGYGLLIMAFVDLLIILTPPQLMNSVWEFETIGTIIERLPVTLIGIVLVFYGERNERTPIEAAILRWLSRGILLLAIMLILTIPLNIVNGFRIYYQFNAKVNAQIIPRVDSIEEFKGKVQAADSLEQIESILETGVQQDLILSDSLDSEQLKTNIIQRLQDNQDTLRSQIQEVRQERRFLLLKKSVKWNLGALVTSVIFLFIWKQTIWARLEVTCD